VRPEVRVVFRGDEPEASHGTRKALRAATEAEGFSFREIPAARLAAGTGRKLSVVARVDAYNLYIRLHRAPVAVVLLCDAVVRRDPRYKLKDKEVVSVRDLCRYKAFVTSLPAASDPAKSMWLDEFAEWRDTDGCEDHRDPRCLPFPVFRTKVPPTALADARGRREFARQYGRPPRRTDHRRVEWRDAQIGARHGRDPVTVASCKLIDGFHWDVSRGSELANAALVWTMGRGGYLNAYPDSILRRGDRCREVWSYEDSLAADGRGPR
jgi:hypothetical protein